MLNRTRKIYSDEHILRKAIKESDRPLVFTNGCFDILHIGHIDLLEEAADLGSSMVVALNTDYSVKELAKGTRRPINSLEERMNVIAALECVDFVTCFNSPTPLDLIQTLKPDHLVKGGDWSLDSIVGAEFVMNYGGQVHSLPFKHNISTTDIVLRISKN